MSCARPISSASSGGAHGALHYGVDQYFPRVLRLGELGVLVHHLREEPLIERAPVHADAHRRVVGDGDVDDLLEVRVPVLGPHVARIDPVLGESPGRRPDAQ